ncbi:unnamed protein product [Durusdinium trenchii]|uniref:Uncharacterized protein n=2 Tax=Durusdinium trenchii TaxID=1381693 RepID=A0ABP0P533_9DINO
METEIDLNYKDHCLIIVGDGGEADELLARRRLAAGGRLAHFTVGHGQVKFAGAAEEVIFAWQPLYQAKPSNLGVKLGQSLKTYWTKSGPDCMELEANQTLQIFTKDQHMRLVRLVNEEGQVLLEMSGEVILNPDEELAQIFEVAVEDCELQAFGTYSRHGVIGSLLILILWHTIRWTVSVKMEQIAEDGQYVWWRGVLVLMNGVIFCCLGLWQSWAASLSGVSDLDLRHKLLCITLVAPVAMVAAASQVADYPLSLIGVATIWISGPFLQYYQTRPQFPERRLLPCLLWTTAQLVATVGTSAVLAAIVVGYRSLLAASQPIVASLFLPVSTASVEGIMVTFTRLMYTNLVVKRRPSVPGDVSFVAAPYMLTAIHGFAEAARLVGLFSGPMKSGSFTWTGALAITLLVNVLARCGWTRFLAYSLVKRLGLKQAWILAPSAYGKLHDEIKIYVGYFRFPAVIALVLARLMVYQDFSLSGPTSPIFNVSAGLALLCMLLVEYLEDHIVVRQIVPMSPILAEFIESSLQKDGFGRHGCLISVDLRVAVEPSSAWRMEEVDESGFKSTRPQPNGSQTCDPSHNVKMSSVVPMAEFEGEIERPSSFSQSHPPTSAVSGTRLYRTWPQDSPSHDHDEVAEARVEKPSSNESPTAPAQTNHQNAPIPSLQLLSIFASEPAGARETPSQRVSVMNLTVEDGRLGSKQSANNLNPEERSGCSGECTPRLVASLGERRTSVPSRVRRWFGQQRAVHPSLLLHGLRVMPFSCHLSAMAIISEVTLSFLNTTVGPAFLRGLIETPCEPQDFDVLVSIWWPCPMIC